MVRKTARCCGRVNPEEVLVNLTVANWPSLTDEIFNFLTSRGETPRVPTRDTPRGH